jgi:3-methyladenine DNA glycosylase AlkD
MSKYMKNRFTFFGIKTTERRQLFKEVWKANKEEVAKNAREIAVALYAKDQREFHYCAIEILIKELKGKHREHDIDLIEKLLTLNSWWDSVDAISKNILGSYLLEFPEPLPKVLPISPIQKICGSTEALFYFNWGIKIKRILIY